MEHFSYWLFNMLETGEEKALVIDPFSDFSYDAVWRLVKGSWTNISNLHCKALISVQEAILSW